MRHLPIQKYSGLTVVLSQPSRQDLHKLLTGYAGDEVFDRESLGPETNRWACDIRTADTIDEGLLPETKGLLLLGDGAFHRWTHEDYKDYTLNEQRGVPLKNKWSLPCISSYSPQDAVDIKDYESEHNPHLQASGEDTETGGEGDTEEDDYSEKKRHGRTRRSNFRHWLRRDSKKILAAISNPEITTEKRDWDIRLYPRAEQLCESLDSLQGGFLYLDIETDLAYNCLCIGLNHSSSNIVFCVPLLRYDYKLAYSSFARVLRSIVGAMRRCTVVIHNSMFDLFVLAWKYRIPPPPRGQIFDTLIAQHRIFPEVEKSLGHCLSAWPSIWEPFHKDEGVFMPWNPLEEQQLWTYNAKDVYGMRLVHEAQMRYVAESNISGLASSIEQGMRSIRPFLLMSLQGIKVDDKLRQEKLDHNDKLMTQYLRMTRILTGPEVDLLPTSSKSCVKYFHDILGYPIAGRSAKTGAPSLNETNMWKLKLKASHNVVVDVCVKYRQTKKESGQLNFNPWIKPKDEQTLVSK